MVFESKEGKGEIKKIRHKRRCIGPIQGGYPRSMAVTKKGVINGAFSDFSFEFWTCKGKGKGKGFAATLADAKRSVRDCPASTKEFYA